MNRFDDAVDALSGLNQEELGYLLSSIRHAVTVSDPSARAQIQARLEQLVQGLATVYLFAIFEEFFPLEEVKKRHNAADEYLAYRHVRHSFAHKPLGQRAKRHRAEFEALIASGRLANLVTWDNAADRIELHDGFSEHLRTFLINSVARIANSPNP